MGYKYFTEPTVCQQQKAHFRICSTDSSLGVAVKEDVFLLRIFILILGKEAVDLDRIKKENGESETWNEGQSEREN